MTVQFETLEIGQAYDRPFLARLWGYNGHQGFSRGVFTPSDAKLIVLFVTKDKAGTTTQYNDYIDGDLLYWEGEAQHGNDRRIINAQTTQTPIHLFYREVRTTSFIYFGELALLDFIEQTDKPSEFVFTIQELALPTPTMANSEGNQEATLHNRPVLETTETMTLAKARLGQGRFRKDVIQLWGSCAVTGFQRIAVLKASHIKPWKASTNNERLDPYNGFLLLPNFDTLFDKGLISFENNGKILVSSQLSDVEREFLSLHRGSGLRRVYPENAMYLEHHRNELFSG